LNLNQALIAKELTCVRGDTELFRNLSFEISPGSILQITGGNGSGKSSLLRILCGLLSPQDGQVLWGQNPIHDDRDYFHSQLLYLGHQPALKGDLTALEFHSAHVSIDEVANIINVSLIRPLQNSIVKTNGLNFEGRKGNLPEDQQKKSEERTPISTLEEELDSIKHLDDEMLELKKLELDYNITIGKEYQKYQIRCDEFYQQIL